MKTEKYVTKRKIWHKLFYSLAVVFVIFASAVLVANSTMFETFFTACEKSALRIYEQKVASVDLTDRDEANDKLREIELDGNVTISIYWGEIPIYSTIHRSAGTHRPNLNGFDMLIGQRSSNMTVLESSKDRFGGTFSTIVSDDGIQYLVYSADSGNYTIDIMIVQSLIQNSASIASRFTIIIMSVFLLIALVWSIMFSRRFAKPIMQMNGIAVKMANLDFSQKVEVDSDDEIGRLATSLNELSESLDTALRELNEKNAKLQDEIEAERKLDVMRKGFVANVSHELKTPISIIQGYSEGLIDGMAEDSEQREKYCRVILDECKRMHSLVINLLELSRYQSGIDANKEEYDLTGTILNIVDKNSSAMDSKHVNVKFDFNEREPVIADPMMMEQVIQNYISNAVSHVPDGGNISIYTEPYGDDNLRICIYNSGSHISDDDMENIWQSFYRVDKSHNRTAGRFGLGLSIVKAIMLAHGRDFGVFNTDDGVVFWSEFERAKPPEIPLIEGDSDNAPDDPNGKNQNDADKESGQKPRRIIKWMKHTRGDKPEKKQRSKSERKKKPSENAAESSESSGRPNKKKSGKNPKK